MFLSTCSYIPLEIPLSLGIEAKRLFPCGGGSQTESYVPRDFCPYAKGILHHVSEFSSGTEAFSLAVAGSCDAMRRIADLLTVYWKQLRVYYVDVPRTSDTSAVDYYASVLKEFASELACVAHTENPISALPETIRAMNSLRRRLNGVFAETVDSPQRKPWAAAIECFLKANDKLGSGEPVTEELLRTGPLPWDGEFRSAGRQWRARRPSVIVTGTTCLEASLVSLIEEAGFRILSVDLCLGTRSTDFQIDENDPDPFHALAEGYLGKPPCPRMLDRGRRTSYLDGVIGRLAARVDGDGVPDGVIYFVPKFCDQGYYDYVELRRFLGARSIPLLLLEGEFGAAASAQIKTRLLAFREMLEMKQGTLRLSRN